MATDGSAAELRSSLADAFTWRGDRTDDTGAADLTEWWRRPELLAALGPALAGLYTEALPTVVLGPESRGVLLGALTASELGVGLVEVRKDRAPAADSDAWYRRTSPPDFADRQIEFGFRRALLRAGDRVLMVDDWVATGATALTVKGLVEDAGATWLGVAAVVDAVTDARLRRDLPLRALLRERELGWYR